MLYTYSSAYTQTLIHKHTHTHTHTHTCLQAYKHACKHTHMHACTYTCIHMHAHTLSVRENWNHTFQQCYTTRFARFTQKQYLASLSHAIINQNKITVPFPHLPSQLITVASLKTFASANKIKSVNKSTLLIRMKS